MSKINTLEIIIENGDPWVISDELEVLENLIKDISYGIEYGGSRNPTVRYQFKTGTDLIIIPSKVQMMRLLNKEPVEVPF